MRLTAPCETLQGAIPYNYSSDILLIKKEEYRYAQISSSWPWIFPARRLV